MFSQIYIIDNPSMIFTDKSISTIIIYYSEIRTYKGHPIFSKNFKLIKSFKSNANRTFYLPSTVFQNSISEFIFRKNIFILFQPNIFTDNFLFKEIRLNFLDPNLFLPVLAAFWSNYTLIKYKIGLKLFKIFINIKLVYYENEVYRKKGHVTKLTCITRLVSATESGTDNKTSPIWEKLFFSPEEWFRIIDLRFQGRNLVSCRQILHCRQFQHIVEALFEGC